jgi:hypothetical protein
LATIAVGNFLDARQAQAQVEGFNLSYFHGSPRILWTWREWRQSEWHEQRQ